MPDIWGRTITLGGVIPGESVLATFGTSSGMIVFNVNIQAQRQMGLRLDLASGGLYLNTTLPQPVVVQFVGVLTDFNTYQSFLNTFASPCTQQDLVLTLRQQVCGTGTTPSPVKYTIKNAKITSIADAISADNYMYLHTVALLGTHVEIAAGT